MGEEKHHGILAVVVVVADDALRGGTPLQVRVCVAFECDARVDGSAACDG